MKEISFTEPSVNFKKLIEYLSENSDIKYTSISGRCFPESNEVKDIYGVTILLEISEFNKLPKELKNLFSI